MALANVMLVEPKGVLSGCTEDGLREIIKGLVNTNITDEGRNPFVYEIASINFDGNHHSNCSGIAPARYELLKKIQRESQRDLIFFQECTVNNPLKQLKAEFNDSYKCEISGKESGIIWNNDVFNVERMNTFNLITEKYATLQPHRGRGRICMCKVSLKDRDSNTKKKEPNITQFMAVSWHGPNKTSDKPNIFEELIKFCMEQETRLELPCLIGGDFNYSAQHADEKIENKTGWCISYDEESKYDFFLSSGGLNLKDITWECLKYDDPESLLPQSDETNEIPLEIILDHKPVLANLDLGEQLPFSPKK